MTEVGLTSVSSFKHFRWYHLLIEQNSAQDLTVEIRHYMCRCLKDPFLKWNIRAVPEALQCMETSWSSSTTMLFIKQWTVRVLIPKSDESHYPAPGLTLKHKLLNTITRLLSTFLPYVYELNIWGSLCTQIFTDRAIPWSFKAFMKIVS